MDKTSLIGKKFIPNNPSDCGNYKGEPNAHHITVTGITRIDNFEYDIMDKDDNRLDCCYGCFNERNTTPLETSKYKVGDILVLRGDERMVLAVLPEKYEKKYVMSHWNDFNKVDVFRSEEGLDEYYTLKGSQAVEEAIRTLEKAGKLKDGKILA